MDVENKKAKKSKKAKLSCMERANNMLSRRGYAVSELIKKLIEKEYEQGEVQDTIERLISYGFLNDEKFAYARIRYRIESSGWGKKRIQTELRQKGVDENLIQQQFNAYFETEAEQSLADNAYHILMKKYGVWNPDMEDASSSYEIRLQQRKEIEKEKNKRVQFLMRRGFSLNEALDALTRTSIK